MANSNKEKMMIGAAVAALAAGAYFFQTDAGKRHAKKLKGWMVRMKGEVLERIEDVGEITEPVYREIVDTVANAQMVSDKIPRSEILALATDLKRQWSMIKRLSHGKKPAKKVVKKSSPKTAKSSSKKASKKKAK